MGKSSLQQDWEDIQASAAAQCQADVVDFSLTVAVVADADVEPTAVVAADGAAVAFAAGVADVAIDGS